MQGLCKYKDVFGEPRKGVHAIRVVDFAAVDIILTILAAAIISKTFNINFLITLIILIIIAIITHKVFCVDTKLNQLLHLNQPPSA